MNSIETVFEWLLAATLRASVLVVVILCIQSVLRRWLPASWRHALWLPMLAVLVLPVLPEAPFALSPKTPAAPAPVSAAPIYAAEMKIADALPMAPASDATFTPSAAVPVAPAKVNFLAIAWFVGAVSVLAAGGIGYHRNLRRIRTNATSPDQLLQLTLAETAHEAGLKRAPHTVISTAVSSPAVTGFVRPVLLLPAGFPEGFSAAEARLILLHEFTHLKRFDLPLNWLMCVLQAMHWFNPLLWFAFARMRADRESACDARVLSIDASDRRAEYGGALLKLQCVTPTRALSLGFVGIFEQGAEIKSRIRDISTHRRTRLVRQIAGGVIVTLLMIFGATKAQQDSPPADEPNTVKEEADKAKHPEILINILKDGKIRFEGQESTDQELTARIGAALKKLPDQPFRIKTDGEVMYQDVVRVIDLCKRAGALNLSFAPESLKEAAPAASGERPEARFIRRKLHFVKVAEILPVAANALKRAQPGQEAVPQPGGATGEKADKAPKDAATDSEIPSSMLVGDTLLVADEITNSLIVQGPPARLIIVESLLDLIDVSPPVQEGGKEAIQEKLRSIIIPTIDFNDVHLEEAVDFLRFRAAELDATEKDPAKKGIYFVISNPDAVPTALIRELRLRNVPLSVALKYICDQTKFRYTVDDTFVILSLQDEPGARPAKPPIEANKEANPAQALIQKKLNTTIIPKIDFENVSMEEAIEFLRVRAAELDAAEKDPAKKGINFVFPNPDAVPAPVIQELKVRNVPLATVLKSICDQTNYRYTVDNFAVTLVPRDPAGAEPAIAPDPANDARDSYAARIKTLSQITSQVGKYPHPTSEFFKSACLLTELQRILGPDYKAYREHLSTAGAGMLEKEGDYVCGDVSQLHVGGYDSLFYVDAKNEKMYLFWLKKSVLEKEYQIYGDGPIPAAVLSSIASHMNGRWGHVASFRFDGERLLFERPKEK